MFLFGQLRVLSAVWVVCSEHHMHDGQHFAGCGDDGLSDIHVSVRFLCRIVAFVSRPENSACVQMVCPQARRLSSSEESTRERGLSESSIENDG
jgi:hypothetical protein